MCFSINRFLFLFILIFMPRILWAECSPYGNNINLELPWNYMSYSQVNNMKENDFIHIYTKQTIHYKCQYIPNGGHDLRVINTDATRVFKSGVVYNGSPVYLYRPEINPNKSQAVYFGVQFYINGQPVILDKDSYLIDIDPVNNYIEIIYFLVKGPGSLNGDSLTNYDSDLGELDSFRVLDTTIEGTGYYYLGGSADSVYRRISLPDDTFFPSPNSFIFYSDSNCMLNATLPETIIVTDQELIHNTAIRNYSQSDVLLSCTDSTISPGKIIAVSYSGIYNQTSGGRLINGILESSNPDYYFTVYEVDHQNNYKKLITDNSGNTVSELLKGHAYIALTTLRFELHARSVSGALSVGPITGALRIEVEYY